DPAGELADSGDLPAVGVELVRRAGAEGAVVLDPHRLRERGGHAAVVHAGGEHGDGEVGDLAVAGHPEARPVLVAVGTGVGASLDGRSRRRRYGGGGEGGRGPGRGGGARAEGAGA